MFECRQQFPGRLEKRSHYFRACSTAVVVLVAKFRKVILRKKKKQHVHVYVNTNKYTVGLRITYASDNRGNYNNCR